MVIKSNLIRKIKKAFAAAYELGDDALDSLCTMPQYNKWLAACMDDDHLWALDNRDLQALFEEIEDVLEEQVW